MAKSVKILVVDDEVAICEIIASYFSIFGYETQIVHSAQDALNLLSEQTFQLVVTDIRMSGMTGTELVHVIKSRQPHTPKIFVISAYSDLKIKDIYSLGADGFFAKPFDSRYLLQAIRQATLPLSEQWKQAPSIEPVNELEFIESPDSRFDIAFGRGGFAVSLPKIQWETGDLLRIRLQLVGRKIDGIFGAGVIRWIDKKENSTKNGVGIEIVYLEEDCRTPVANWFSQQSVVEFIPKL